MFAIILTVSDNFLATLRAIAREFPGMPVNVNSIQELVLNPEISEIEASRIAADYIASGRYDRVEVIRL